MIFRFTSIIFIISLASCSIGYYANAGYHQSRILLNRVSIKKALNDNSLDYTLREKLITTKNARDYAIKIGLNPEETFTSYTKAKNIPKTWVVTASPELKLEAYTWEFPIVGRLPYKGFFSREDSTNEMEKLAEKGYDTNVRTAAAYSTLGWFNDPVMPATLELETVSLFNTVVHEIVHTTIWIADNASYNETMAHSIGLLASMQYFKDKDQELFEKTIKQFTRECEYSVKFKETHRKLKETYSSDLTKDEKKLQKKEIYKNLGINPNNALFLSYYTYLQNLPSFLELFLKSGDLSKYINTLDSLSKINKKEVPFKVLTNQINSLLYKNPENLNKESICTTVIDQIKRDMKHNEDV